MRLTRSHLLKHDDWMDWQTSEYLQLNQYADQGCFGAPTPVDKYNGVFHLVRTYNIKTLDGHKKAHCVCDCSSQSGLVKIIKEIYANCINQTSSRLFYAVLAAKNLLIFGFNVCNTFAKAPPPKQGFFIRPGRAFNEWWENHMNKPPIPPGHMIPVLSVMQGHPKSPRLWEKHADTILHELGLTPTTHEPCLYSGVIYGKRVVFMCQVDNFAIAAPNQQTADILFNMLEEKLTMPIKRQGRLDMFDGVGIFQTKNYVKSTATPTSTSFAQNTLTCGSTKSPSWKINPPPSLWMATGSNNLTLPLAWTTPKRKPPWKLQCKSSIAPALVNLSGQ
jgi:hypothetical protein